MSGSDVCKSVLPSVVLQYVLYSVLIEILNYFDRLEKKGKESPGLYKDPTLY